MDNYYTKYLKYKNKYLELKGIKGIVSINNIVRGGGNDGSYYTKYMKYKTKYIKEKGLVGGALGTDPCPDTFGLMGFTSKSVWWYIRNYNCDYKKLHEKIPKKVDAISRTDFISTNEDHPEQKITVADLKNRGFSALFLKNAGFSAKELKEGEFSANSLKVAGFDAIALKEGGFSAIDLKNEGFDAKELKEGGFDAKELIDVGFTLQQLKEGGFSAIELYIADKQVPELIEILKQIKSGTTLMDFVDDKNGLFMYNLKNLKKFFSVKEFKKVRHNVRWTSIWNSRVIRYEWYTKNDLKKAGFTEEQVFKIFEELDLEPKDKIVQLKDLDINARTLYEYGYKLSELKSGEFSASELRQAGFSANALKEEGFSISELRQAGFSAKELRQAEFSISELRQAGFGANELRQAEFSANALKEEGFSAYELKQAGYRAYELINVDFNEGELKQMGFSAKELRQEWFTLEKLKKGGFTASELKSAAYSALELKNVGFTLEQLEHAGYNKDIIKILKLKVEGKSIEELKNKPYNFRLIQLKEGGFSYKELKEAGSKFVDLLTEQEKNDRQHINVYKLKKLKEAGFPTIDFRGINSFALIKAGFTDTELKEAKISISNYVLIKLLEEGFKYDQFKKAGFKFEDLLTEQEKNDRQHINVYKLKKLKEAGFPIIDFRGITNLSLIEAGFKYDQFKKAGIKFEDFLTELEKIDRRHISVDKLEQLKKAEFPITDFEGINSLTLIEAGFTVTELQEAQFSISVDVLTKLLKDGYYYDYFNKAGIKFEDFLTEQEKNDRQYISVDKLELLQEAQFPTIDFKGINSLALIKAGFTVTELQEAQISISVDIPKILLEEGFNYDQLKEAGFTDIELKSAGFTDKND
jgi:intracellular multiplication protein IcmE